MFIADMYDEQRIIREGIMPAYMVESSKGFLTQCKGMKPSKGIWCHITGTDLVRGVDGKIYVLEDNLRCPSGVSYVIENREVMKRSFPQLFNGQSILPVESYPEQLLKMLLFVAPESARDPNVVVLTPGIYNSAYFEHCFLAQQMGVELVQGSDLCVSNGYVNMRTTRGLQRVDVIYRRIDDDFLDPTSLRPDSTLGVPGLMDVYRAGRVSLVNAPGTGVADDKAVYAYVPKMIEFYLKEEMKLPNVPTYLCADESERKYVLDNIADLVIKPANESGGYGILLGPRATQEELSNYRSLIASNPRNYVAQPMLSLSRVPTLCGDRLEGRHVDLHVAGEPCEDRGSARDRGLAHHGRGVLVRRARLFAARHALPEDRRSVRVRARSVRRFRRLPDRVGVLVQRDDRERGITLEIWHEARFPKKHIVPPV